MSDEDTTVKPMSDEDTTVKPMSDEDTTVKDLEFLRGLTSEQIDPYRGEWVAINDGKIIAHGEYAEDVIGEAWKSGVKSPLIERFYNYPSEVPYFYTGP